MENPDKNKTDEIQIPDEIIEDILAKNDTFFHQNLDDDQIEQFLRSMSHEELLRFDRLMDMVLTAESDDDCSETSDDDETILVEIVDKDEQKE